MPRDVLTLLNIFILLQPFTCFTVFIKAEKKYVILSKKTFLVKTVQDKTCWQTILHTSLVPQSSRTYASSKQCPTT